MNNQNLDALEKTGDRAAVAYMKDEKFHMSNNTMQQFINVCYSMYMQNVISVCRTYDYFYAPSDRYDIRDSNIFYLSLMGVDKGKYDPEFKNCCDLDISIASSIKKSMQNGDKLYQPIWVANRNNIDNRLFVFDGVHRLMAMVMLQSDGVAVQKILCPIITKEASYKPVDLYVPESVYEALDYELERSRGGGEYNLIYKFNINGMTWYKISVKGVSFIINIVTYLSIYVDNFYRYNKSGRFKLEPADILSNGELKGGIEMITLSTTIDSELMGELKLAYQAVICTNAHKLSAKEDNAPDIVKEIAEDQTQISSAKYKSLRGAILLSKLGVQSYNYPYNASFNFDTNELIITTKCEAFADMLESKGFVIKK